MNDASIKHIDIFTDGSCSGNPGPGGWAAILKYDTKIKELCGGDSDTTNNRMELTAVIEALRALKEPCDVLITTDSQYIVNAVEKKWVYAWKSKGWKKADGKPALNTDLWQRLLQLLDTHSVSFCWIKGHDGHPENERCDTLAVAMTAKYTK